MWLLYCSIQQKSVRYYSPFNKNVWKNTNGDRNYLKQQKSVEFLLFWSRFSSSVCTKHDALGNIIRYKARSVTKSYSQVAGVDFEETFTPVAKFITIRIILAIAAAMDWDIHQMDVKTAFLNGVLEVVIYMDQPEGFVQKGKEHLVCKLIKALYGLKQSPRAWYQRIDSFFINEGFCRSHADHSLYIKQTDDYILSPFFT